MSEAEGDYSGTEEKGLWKWRDWLNGVALRKRLFGAMGSWKRQGNFSLRHRKGTDTFIPDFQPPELWENTFLFNPSSLWSFMTSATGNEYRSHCRTVETTLSILTSLLGPGQGPFPELGPTDMDQHSLSEGENHTMHALLRSAHQRQD